MAFSPEGYASSANKWTKKLTRFPITSKKKKSPLDSDEQLFFAPINDPILPLRSAPVTPVQYDESYPLRFSSMPRPNTTGKFRNESFPATSGYSDIASPTPYPPGTGRVGSSHRANKTKSLVHIKCSICNESISNRGSGERVIELKCGHICHNDCLLVSFESSSSKEMNVSERFPLCLQCKEDKSEDIACVPKDNIIEEELLSSFFINNFETTKTNDSDVLHDISTSVSTPLRTQGTFEGESIDELPDNNVDEFTTDRPYNINTSMMKAPVPQIVHNHPTDLDRPSPILGIPNSGQIGIPARSYRRNIGTHSTVDPLTVVIHSFVDFIIHRLPVSLSTTQFHSEFGTLRIVDWLNVSTSIPKYETCCCFLFSKRLLIAFTDKSPEEVTNEDLNQVEFKSFAIYSLDGCTLRPVSSSIFEVTFLDSNRSGTVRFSELWDNNSNTITQRWISAILNPALLLDSETFTSTVKMSGVTPQKEETENIITNVNYNNGSTTTEKDTSDKIMPLKLDKKKSYMSSGFGDRKRSSVLSQMTSVSSIMSMKRKKPETIVIVLQIDGEKLKFQNISAVIYNSLVALSLSFKSMYIYFVDSQLNLFQEGFFEGMFKCSNEFKFMTVNPYNPKFDVTHVEERLRHIPNETSVGIVFSSGCAFNEHNILRMPTDSLKRSNQKRNNILKVKIGYMNDDNQPIVTDLIEIDNWSNLLEVICYTYSVSFEDDERDSYCPSEIVRKDSSIEDDYSITHSGSEDSLLTLNISSGIN